MVIRTPYAPVLPPNSEMGKSHLEYPSEMLPSLVTVVSVLAAIFHALYSTLAIDFVPLILQYAEKLFAVTSV